MPYVHLQTDRPLGANQAESLRAAVAACLADTLSKPPARCMIRIDGAQSIAMGDGEEGCAFVELRVHGAVEAQRADACAAALKAALFERLAIPPERIYLNILPMTDGPVIGRIY